MKLFRLNPRVPAVAMAILMVAAQTAPAYVPVRVSIKFVLSAAGTRPAFGNLNTNNEINAEFNAGNTILDSNMSELRLEMLELVDLAGVSQYYSAAANDTNRDNLRADAIANPATYRWRNDAINIYINAGTDAAISQFPPDNDIVLMNQWCANNPSCILHELGHSLNLYHTHSNLENCADTISDDQNWTRDQIALSNFGTTYNNLSAAQKDQVNLVFNNVMSYHTGEPQLRLSNCQRDRTSTQGDADRAWLLTREPIYVNNSNAGAQNGRFTTPYRTLQSAVSAGVAGKVIVLQQGSHPVGSPVIITANSEVVTRSGTSTVGDGALLYRLPVELEKSEVPEVRSAIEVVQLEDNEARKAMRDAEAAAKQAATVETRDAMLSEGVARMKLHQEAAIAHLKNAEKYAEGNEQLAIQLEIAQRLRDTGNCTDAAPYFQLVADHTDQIHLRERALLEVTKCRDVVQESR